MKRLIILIICVLVLVGCNPTKHLTKQNDNFDRQYARELILTESQLDSLCVADTLDKHFKEWYRAAFVDYQTNKVKEKKMYGKWTNEKRVYYILSPYNENRYKLIIRTEEKTTGD